MVTIEGPVALFKGNAAQMVRKEDKLETFVEHCTISFVGEGISICCSSVHFV